MRNKKPVQGKILLHGKRAGEMADQDIESRAREIASIDGRPAADVTRKDRNQARRELSGLDLPPTTDEDSASDVAITRDPSEPPSESGHQVPDQEEPDEQTSTERLAEDGVEEAQHEQMLAARRRARRQE